MVTTSKADFKKQGRFVHAQLAKNSKRKFRSFFQKPSLQYAA